MNIAKHGKVKLIKDRNIVFAKAHRPICVSLAIGNRAVIQSNINFGAFGRGHPTVSIKNRQDIQTEIVVQMSLA